MQKFSFDDVLLVPQYSEINSRSEVDISSCGYSTPIILAPMDSVANVDTINWLGEHGIASVSHRKQEAKELIENTTQRQKDLTFVALGLNDMEKAKIMYDSKFYNFCVDVAHGDQKQVLKFISELKRALPVVKIMAGNVVTESAVVRLNEAGADFIRIGVGSGAACTTRLMTGHGYPQLSAVIECSKGKYGSFIVADGGIRSPGDAVKALAAGADFVMMGRYFAGTHLVPGEVVLVNGKEHVEYRGMASREANLNLEGAKHRPAEGGSYLVPYKNMTQSNLLVQDLLGGIRSGLTYSGARNLTELRDKAKFVHVSNSTILENGLHGKMS